MAVLTVQYTVQYFLASVCVQYSSVGVSRHEAGRRRRGVRHAGGHRREGRPDAPHPDRGRLPRGLLGGAGCVRLLRLVS